MTTAPASRGESTLPAPASIDLPRLDALEDLEARSGSSAALLRTIVGSVLRPLGGWMSSARAVELLAALDIPGSTARSALTRLCARGVLAREVRRGAAGYGLTAAAIPMLERGDLRIFADRTPAPDDSWCLVSYSIPESHRSRRHRLRRRLESLGCGTVSDGLWIAPSRLAGDLRDATSALAAPGEATLFTEVRPDTAELPVLVAGWYDLDRMRAAHNTFLAHFGDAADPATDREAFARWMRALDEWRVIPYLDPGLPAAALPSDWPGARSAALFDVLLATLAPRALAHARLAAASRTSAEHPADTRPGPGRIDSIPDPV
ncbi:PaaX family transcriptional regulator C-terminal domain-containing protein [Leifsonia sp. NPDC058230]|uniref:PaaX family transcriptional regulator n=1 Tax=Leifsonia sp. NPDC058230 TaxID=3346391 RepID=UPI0036DAF021